MSTILTRDNFRDGVFHRDNFRCVICGLPAQDAHHIIERRLWSDGGYYLDNGASLCGEHHLLAESTELSCEDIRTAAGITITLLPDDLYHDTKWDKWGNPYTPDGARLRGPLYSDDSVRKIIKGDFLFYTKYPRTYHLPWSQGRTKDDRVMPHIGGLIGRNVVVTEKMDGENTSLYRDYIHARGFDYGSHPSRNMVKALHSTICGEIPIGWRICGENLFARHSLAYDDLESYFLVFSIWDDKNECLSWTETEEWCSLLGLSTVPVLRKEKCYNSEDLIHSVAEVFSPAFQEGYVVRTEEGFPLKDFRKYVGKYVRKNHVTTSSHWKYEKVIPNGLRKA